MGIRHARRWVPLFAGTAAMLAAAPAWGATTIGATDPGPHNCGEDAASSIQIANAAASPSYGVPPGPGVITSWQHDAATTTVTENPTGIDVRLKVFRLVGGLTYLTVGHSAVQTITSPGLQTFQTRIPVQGGDRLGFSQLELGRTRCTHGMGEALPDDQFGGNTANVDPAVGSDISFMSGGTPIRLNVSATVEPDADEDGFGDETQDACPSEGDTQGACVPPETTITRRPKDRSKKKKATFEFASSEAGSSFLCSIDGRAFATCASPHVIKVGKGRHELQVQAVDPGGTPDPSPDADTWKVRKKRKKP
jgi:hypothetical protein